MVKGSKLKGKPKQCYFLLVCIAALFFSCLFFRDLQAAQQDGVGVQPQRNELTSIHGRNSESAKHGDTRSGTSANVNTFSTHELSTTNACVPGSSFAPRSFGARGDGVTNDTTAFISLFDFIAQCPGSRVDIGPAGAVFLVEPGVLSVKLHNVSLSFSGEIVGPNLTMWNEHLETWPKGSCAYGESECADRGVNPEYARARWSLLHIKKSSDVVIQGHGGGLRAPGWSFWPTRYKRPEIRGYCLLKIDDCHHISISGLKLADSPMYHIIVLDSHSIQLDRVRITISGDLSSFRKRLGKWGPDNTDGINILNSKDVHFQDCEVQSGDDNIVIKAGSQRISGRGLKLQFGKGISIGSIGEGGTDSQVVKDISFSNVKVNTCRHGVRIKTWQGGVGSIQNVAFESFKLSGVKIVILIDQKYCPRSQRPEGCDNLGKRSVSIKNISFTAFSGSYYYRDKDIKCTECEKLTYEGISLKKI